jgi:NIMA (never in mitosis gene a)-related kinase
MSPEVAGGRAYSAKSDVWSMGVLLYQLCCLKYPFEAPSVNALMMKIIHSKQAPIPYTYSSGLRNLTDAFAEQGTEEPSDCFPVAEERVDQKSYWSTDGRNDPTD